MARRSCYRQLSPIEDKSFSNVSANFVSTQSVSLEGVTNTFVFKVATRAPCPPFRQRTRCLLTHLLLFRNSHNHIRVSFLLNYKTITVASMCRVLF